MRRDGKVLFARHRLRKVFKMVKTFKLRVQCTNWLNDIEFVDIIVSNNMDKNFKLYDA